MQEQEKKLPKELQSLNAAASAMQIEIDVYRHSEMLHRKRARRKTAIALVLIGVCLLATLALVAMYFLSRYEKIEPLSLTFLYALAGAILAVVLVALCFLIGSRDDKVLALDCERRMEERRGQLADVLHQIEEERRREEEAKLKIAETLAPLPPTRAQKIAHALRVTSAVLSALSVPVAALAAFYKDVKKKK